MALAIAEEGGGVVVFDRDREVAEEIAIRACDGGGRAFPFVGDV